MRTKLSAKSELQRLYLGKFDRSLRETRSGWLLIDGQGNRFPLTASQAARLRAEGEARLEAMFAQLPGQSWIRLTAIVGTLVLAIWLGAQLAVPGTVPTAAYLLPCSLFAFKDALAGIELALDFAHLRSELAAKAARLGHCSAPPERVWLADNWVGRLGGDRRFVGLGRAAWRCHGKQRRQLTAKFVSADWLVRQLFSIQKSTRASLQI